MANLDGPQFAFTKANLKDMNTKRHQHKLEAYDDLDDWVGEMEWSPKTGELKNIFVEGNYRRQGYGTALWNEAKSIAQREKGVVPPAHSPDRTDAGDAWAKSTKDRVPKRLSSPTHRYEDES